jgi:ABC-2 type transport system permease protein
MTTTTVQKRATHVASPARVTFPRLLRSEWIKLSTLRSTWWAIGISALLTIGIALIAGASLSDAQGFEPIQAVVSPIQFTMLLAGILGVISVTGEYSTGMIRSTLTAEPVRGAVLAAKATVIAIVLFVSSLITFSVAAIAVTPFFADNGGFGWDDPAKSTLPILVASVSMPVFALIGVAFGFLIRSGAGAIAATVGLLFVLPIIGSIFAVAGDDWAWITSALEHLPMSAAQSIILPQDNWGLPVAEAWTTLAAWVAGGMLAAWAVLRTRDA